MTSDISASFVEVKNMLFRVLFCLPFFCRGSITLFDKIFPIVVKKILQLSICFSDNSSCSFHVLPLTVFIVLKKLLELFFAFLCNNF